MLLRSKAYLEKWQSREIMIKILITGLLMNLFKKPQFLAKNKAPSKAYGLLLVDDEVGILDGLADMLSNTYRVETAQSGEIGLQKLAEIEPGTIHAIIADQRMPGMSGVEFLEKTLERFPGIGRIVLTGYTDFQAAVHSINRCKASAFLLKPFKEADLFATIAKVISEFERAKTKQRSWQLTEIVGNGMRMFLENYSELPHGSANVLIHGETGTGKELVARAIHDNSPRAQRAFIPIHCGALPETLFEAELFGHKRGAFTGASADRQGRVVQAHGGTLFIDEVAEIPLTVQAKLLRFFQSGEYQRVGSDQTGKVDVRIIAATHQDLPKMVAEGRFRQDLYYRLNVVSLTIPPLRERMGDLDALCHAFLVKHGKGTKSLSMPAALVLKGYHFPGNVRELEHCIERACALCSGEEIRPQHLPAEVLEHFSQAHPLTTTGFTFVELTNEELKAARKMVTQEAVDSLERDFLRQLMTRFSSVSQAAQHAGMARPYLHRLLSKHKLSK